MLTSQLFSITIALQLSATLCAANNALADERYLLDPASLEGLLEHHFPAAQPALFPSPVPNKLHYARQNPEETLVTNSGVEETLSYEDVAPPHTPSPPASQTRVEDPATSDRPRTVAGPPIPPTTSTSSAPPSLPTVCPACPDYSEVTLADGSKCEQCLRDGSRGSWTTGVSCQSVGRGDGTLPDPSDDGRPTACLGTGDTPNTRTCLEGCNSMLLLSQSSNPCSPNIISAANACRNCVNGGAILTSLDGSGSGGFSNNFDPFLDSLRGWCARVRRINLDTGRSLDASDNNDGPTRNSVATGNSNGGGAGTSSTANNPVAETPSSAPSSSVRSNAGARNAAVTQVSSTPLSDTPQDDTTLTTSTTPATLSAESSSTTRSSTISSSAATVTSTLQSLSTSTAVSVVIVTDAQGQTSLSTSTTLATITASIATSATTGSVRALGPQGTVAPTNSPGQSGEGYKAGISSAFITLTVLSAVLTLAYL